MPQTKIATSEVFREAVGRRIAEVRRLRGLTQAEVADRMDVHKNMVSRMERGDSAPGAGLLWRLGRALSVSVDYLLYGLSSSKSNKPEFFRPPEGQ
jgi:transcriptional regulator with XRE-family HTH domain